MYVNKLLFSMYLLFVYFNIDLLIVSLHNRCNSDVWSFLRRVTNVNRRFM